MTANDRSSEEVRAREATIAFSVVQIGKRTVCTSLVQPLRYSVKDLGPSLLSCDGSSLELPIGLKRSRSVCPQPCKIFTMLTFV